MNWPPVILVAEDNDDEFVLLRCAFETAGLPHSLIGVANGAEALQYLYAEEGYSNRARFPFPDLFLLDLHMPVMNGLQVLAAVSNRIEFHSLPIVVLSAGDDPIEIRTTLRLGAQDYIVKPVSMLELVDIVRSLHSRWLSGRQEPAPEPRYNPWAFLQTGKERPGKE